VCHLLATKYWVIVSKLFYNKFTDDFQFKTDGPFDVIYCISPQTLLPQELEGASNRELGARSQDLSHFHNGVFYSNCTY